jgi:hypothetical protein
MEFSETASTTSAATIVQQCIEDRGIACSFWRGVGRAI